MFIVFIELAYDYQPLLLGSFIGASVMQTSHAFIVRARLSGNLLGAFTMDSSGNYVRSRGGTGARMATTQGATVDNCANFTS
ncbi:hypothetical protein [Sphingomonas paeninsulae]|nr:hypothetical protein [Sphingomonas paeninsulae]